MKQRRRQWGSVTYDKARGKWRARAGDDRRTTVGSFDTEAEADAALEEAHRFDRLSLRATGPNAALAAFGRAWLDREERLGIRRSIGRMRSRFECHIARAPFAEWPIAAITRGDVQHWVRELAAAPAMGVRGKGQRRSVRTVKAILTLLRGVLGAALDDGIIDASPAEGIRLPRRETTQALTLLSGVEVELLRTTTALPLRSHAAYLVACYCGLRPGELWGLRWEDVRLGGRAHLIVRHSRDRGTKTGEPRRVPLLEPARAALEGLAATLPSGRMLRGLVWAGKRGAHHADGYDAGWADRPQEMRVSRRLAKRYPNVAHPPRMYTQLGHRWQAGITQRLPLKDLRHTCASHLLRGTWVAAGWIDRPLRIEEVSQWLGHTSIETTQRHYAELAPGGLLDVVPATRSHVRAVEGE